MDPYERPRATRGQLRRAATTAACKQTVRPEYPCRSGAGRLWPFSPARRHAPPLSEFCVHRGDFGWPHRETVPVRFYPVEPGPPLPGNGKRQRAARLDRAPSDQSSQPWHSHGIPQPAYATLLKRGVHRKRPENRYSVQRWQVLQASIANVREDARGVPATWQLRQFSRAPCHGAELISVGSAGIGVL